MRIPEAARLSRALELFGPRARLIGHFATTPVTDAAHAPSEAELLGVLARHPCTLTELAAALGRPSEEVGSLLEVARGRGAVHVERRPSGEYYQLTRESGEQAES